MNQWDTLSSYFNTHEDRSKIHPAAADNILIAWPSLMHGIQQVQTEGLHLNALDYGCGTGGFCEFLQKLGYSVVGCDSSPSMIAVAQKNIPHIPFYSTEAARLNQLLEKSCHLITAIMVLQFVEDIGQLLIHLNNILQPNGLLAFAVFNPDYVEKNYGVGKSFIGFDNHLKQGFLCLTQNTKIPVFIRTLEEYDQLLVPLGYKRIYTEKPPFTDEYLKQYQPDGDVSSPEYLVMVYQKNESSSG